MLLLVVLFIRASVFGFVAIEIGYQMGRIGYDQLFDFDRKPVVLHEPIGQNPSRPDHNYISLTRNKTYCHGVKIMCKPGIWQVL